MQEREVNATKADMLHKNIMMCNDYITKFIATNQASVIKNSMVGARF